MSENRDDIHEIRGTINIMDFLEKPITKERLELSLNIVNYGLEIRSCISTDDRLGKEFIFVKVDKKKIRVNIDSILYIKIVTKSNTHVVYSTLTNFTKGLPKNKFMRVHRSYTVALDKIDAIDRSTLEIGVNKNIFSRKYIDEIREKLSIDDE
jgi:DNA-binding LytR/AlgR family response regulator